MTASTPGNPFGGQRARTTGGQPQRVFVNSSNQVSRPPVLFRMPSVKAETTSLPEGSPQSSITSLAENSATAEPSSQTSRRGTTESKLAAGNKSPLRAPHFPLTPSEAPEAGLKNGPSPVLKPEAVPVKAAEVVVSSGESELEKVQERTSKSRPVPIPPVAPLPTNKSWMEVIGSRVVILLLIGAITAIAFFANREPVLDNEASLTTIQLDSLDKDGASQAAANLATSKTETAPANTTDSLNTSTPKPANSTAPSSTGSTVKVEAVEPTFDIAMLNAPLVTSSDNRPTTETASSRLNQPRISIAASPASSPTTPTQPQSPLPKVNSPTSKPLDASEKSTSPASGNWRDDLRSMDPVAMDPVAMDPVAMDPVANTQPSRAAINSPSAPVIQQNQPAFEESPVRTNTWANSQSATNSRANSTNDSWLGPYSANDTISADEAIRAVIDAAVVAPINSGAGYPTTNQPQGVPDWRRYLPTDANVSAGSYLPSNPSFPADAYPSTNYPTSNNGPNYNGPNYNGPNYNGGISPLVPANSMNPPAGQGAEAQRSFSGLPGQSQFNGGAFNGGALNGNAIPSNQPLPPGFMFQNNVARPASYGNGPAGYAPTNFGLEGQTGMDSSPGMIGQ